jgi:hypothetical protein
MVPALCPGIRTAHSIALLIMKAWSRGCASPRIACAPKLWLLFLGCRKNFEKTRKSA